MNFSSHSNHLWVLKVFFEINESEWVGAWVKHISNVMSLMSTLYSYTLQLVLINKCCIEYEWIRVVGF